MAAIRSSDVYQSLEEDLKRRDFTINAMAYHPEHEDWWIFLTEWKIWSIKSSAVSGIRWNVFMRMLFGCSVQCVFPHSWDLQWRKNTKAALALACRNLERVSAERIQTELVKLLVSHHPDYLRMAYETGITREFLPEFDACMETEQNTPHHCYTVGEHILNSLLLRGPENDRFFASPCFFMTLPSRW